MYANDFRAFTMGDLVRAPEPVQPSQSSSAFAQAQAEYEARKRAEELERIQKDEEYQKIRTYAIIGSGIFAVVAVVFALRSRN